MGTRRREGTLIVAALCISCASGAKDFKRTDVGANEGVILGRVHVVLNGIDETEHCAVCFNSVNGPCQKLEKSGLVVLALAAGPATFRRVSCQQKVEHHYHFEGADFRVAAQSKNYFGDIVLEWNNDRSFKPSALFGVFGAIADQSSNDGTIAMTVVAEQPKALAEYAAIVPDDESTPVLSSIVAAGR